MKKNIKSALSLILVFIIVMLLPATSAFAQNARTIRVGYTDYNNFIQKQDDGTYTGYAVDYFDEISKYTSWNYEYVYGDWSDLLEKLENKEIDLLCSAQKTEKREKVFDYSSYPLGYTQGLLYTRLDNDELHYIDFESLNGKKVGMLKGNAMLDFYKKYEKANNFLTEIIEFDNESSMLNSLNNDEIDALATEHISCLKDLKLVANFASDNYFIVSYKGSSYIDDVNYALSEINKDPHYMATVYDK